MVFIATTRSDRIACLIDHAMDPGLARQNFVAAQLGGRLGTLTSGALLLSVPPRLTLRNTGPPDGIAGSEVFSSRSGSFQGFSELDAALHLLTELHWMKARYLCALACEWVVSPASSAPWNIAHCDLVVAVVVGTDPWSSMFPALNCSVKFLHDLARTSGEHRPRSASKSARPPNQHRLPTFPWTLYLILTVWLASSSYVCR